jgi:hypothetical protein
VFYEQVQKYADVVKVRIFIYNFSWVGFESPIKKFGRAVACAVFNCACKLRWLFKLKVYSLLF